ncbi:MAG TPA: hypothetical protein VKR82_17705 [Candidatus Acidoferrales bacterium]|nr:hypothetical protein [Candidatus Acidoferrales bacterium]
MKTVSVISTLSLLDLTKTASGVSEPMDKKGFWLFSLLICLTVFLTIAQ